MLVGVGIKFSTGDDNTCVASLKKPPEKVRRLDSGQNP